MIILFFYFKKLFITLKNVGDGVMSVPQNLPHSVGSSFLPNMVEFKRHFCRLKNDGANNVERAVPSQCDRFYFPTE